MSSVRRFCGDVLATRAVAAGGATDEQAVLVDERDRGPVDLRLDDVGDRVVGAETLADVVREFLERLVGRHLLERAHRVRCSTFVKPAAGAPPTRWVGESGT